MDRREQTIMGYNAYFNVLEGIVSNEIRPYLIVLKLYKINDVTIFFVFKYPKI